MGLSQSVKRRQRASRARLLCVFLFLILVRVAPVSSQADEQAGQPDSQPSPTALEISVLSYNIHGLPAWIAWDDPALRSRHIGKLLNAYDVVLLQEDFVYHAVLAREVSHAIIRRGNGARSKLFGLASPLCGTCGSGLTFMAGFSPNLLHALMRQPFPVCSGWFTAGQDCWATKGLVQARLELPNQTSIDFYTLHLDAGLSDQDQATRLQQLQVAQQHIQTHSSGQAVVIGGDFNLRSGVEQERELLNTFAATLQLQHSPVWLQPSGNRPRVDHILYRSGEDVRLDLLEAGVAGEFVLPGLSHQEPIPLSDHPAIWGRFRVDKKGEPGS